jgi:hypothetical protein
LLTLVAPRESTRVDMRFTNRFDAELLGHLKTSGMPDYLPPRADARCDFFRSVINYHVDRVDLLINVQKPQEERALVVDYDALYEAPSWRWCSARLRSHITGGLRPSDGSRSRQAHSKRCDPSGPLCGCVRIAPAFAATA